MKGSSAAPSIGRPGWSPTAIWLGCCWRVCNSCVSPCQCPLRLERKHQADSAQPQGCASLACSRPSHDCFRRPSRPACEKRHVQQHLVIARPPTFAKTESTGAHRPFREHRACNDQRCSCWRRSGKGRRMPTRGRPLLRRWTPHGPLRLISQGQTTPYPRGIPTPTPVGVRNWQARLGERRRRDVVLLDTARGSPFL